jgi:hypothetical protein
MMNQVLWKNEVLPVDRHDLPGYPGAFAGRQRYQFPEKRR